MPRIGEIKTARELGRNYKKGCAKFIYWACSSCGEGRWVPKGGYKPSYCRKCWGKRLKENPLRKKRNQDCSLLIAKQGELKDNITIEISDEETTQHCAKCVSYKCPFDDEYGRPLVNYRLVVYNKPIEAVYQCKKCGEMETLSFVKDKLQPTRKFIQVGDTIYHTLNCGECRMLLWINK